MSTDSTTSKDLIVAPEHIVSLQFTLRDEEKNVIDQSEPGEPLVYLHGVGALVPGLERALEGKKAGDSAEVSLNADEGYGQYEEGLTCVVSREEFPEDSEVEVGALFEVSGPDGEEMLAHVIEVDGDDITLDGNHPLAGMALHFSVTILAIRAATAEEIEHGHAHDAGGCGGGEGGHTH